MLLSMLTTSSLSILIHSVISLPDATSYDKYLQLMCIPWTGPDFFEQVWTEKEKRKIILIILSQFLNFGHLNEPPNWDSTSEYIQHIKENKSEFVSTQSLYNTTHYNADLHITLSMLWLPNFFTMEF